MIEVEIKARVEDPKYIERTIISLGAAPIGIENQADTYYNSSSYDFEKTDEALRIRAQDSKYFLTYKGPKMDSISKTRKEFEVEIHDANVMGDILSSLGFSPVATIVKRRKIYRIWDFSIALDNVRSLGDFIEVEIVLRDSNNYEEKVESIFRFINKLGINRESTVRESYLEMFLRQK